MNQSNYDEQNRIKASFYAAYTALTPHRYLHNMTAVDYRMADYMNPFLTAVVDASVSPPPQRPVRILDLGCSYGVSGALLKTNCSYQELANFFRYETSSEYSSCVTESKRWLESHVARECTASGFLDSGLTVFASTPPRPTRGGRVASGPGFGSRTSPASTARCTSA